MAASAEMRECAARQRGVLGIDGYDLDRRAGEEEVEVTQSLSAVTHLDDDRCLDKGGGGD